MTSVLDGRMAIGPTDTRFVGRANIAGTKVGTDKKADPADAAKSGYEAMLDEKSHVVAVAGWKDPRQVIISNVMPAQAPAAADRSAAKPALIRS